MKKKKETPEETRQKLCDGLIESIRRYDELLLHGGQDPFYPDGVNLNLVRNHIIYYRRELLQLCKAWDLRLPEECFIPVPEQIDNGYMASLNQTDRVKRLQTSGYILTTQKPKKRNTQLCFF